MNEQKLKLLDEIGMAKARCIRRLCMILDNKKEIYDVEDLMKKTREEITYMINDNLDHPYQRFDS